MEHVGRQIDIGLHWLNCGWRVFGRNPWLLGGMGISAVIVITLLTLIPVVGGAMIALLTPTFLASAYLAIDGIAHQKMALPAALRVQALKRSPLDLFSVMRREDRIMTILLVSVCTMGIALVINLVAQLAGGSSWVARWSTLEILPMLGVLALAFLILILYAGLAMLLVYALALSVLKDEPLVPAFQGSIHVGLRYPVAVVLILGVLFAPFLFGMVLSPLSLAVQYLIWILVGGVVLPVVTSTLYCSYRHVLKSRETPEAE